MSEPVEYFDLTSMIRDEGLTRVLTMLGRLITRPSSLREMLRAMPHEQRAEPYIDFFVLAGRKSS